MKLAATISRYLLGLIFVVFGLNGFLHFLPMGPIPPGPGSQFLEAIVTSHHFQFVALVQLVSGALFLAGRYVPLALTIIAPVIVNILLFHILMAPATIAPGILVTILWFIVFTRYRPAFAGILTA